ncbi:MAG TPA: hypothetical protein VGI39_12500, partial [Polyangiaceae bacterium]
MPAILERVLGRALMCAPLLATPACFGQEGPSASPSAGEVVVLTATEDAGTDPTAEDPCADAGDRGDGSTFADLYRDYFGPTGLASCSARSICHVPGGTGAQTSHYICAPDLDACWASMTSSIV